MVMGLFLAKQCARAGLASVPPLMLTGMFAAACKLAELSCSLHDSYIWWVVVAAIAIIPPVSRLSLWVLFSPLEAFCDASIAKKKLSSDGNRRPNSSLQGNFAPIQKELAFECTEVSGTIPDDITGVYLRVGPNAKYIPKNGGYHLFDGDGMVHGVRLAGGRAAYCNRYVRTPRLQEEVRRGRAVALRLGELAAPAGLAKMLLQLAQRCVGYYDDLGGALRAGTANTALLLHARRAFALVESDLPFRLGLEVDGGAGAAAAAAGRAPPGPALEVRSLGHDDFDGQLTHAVSAHPKVDPRTGELLALCYDLQRARVSYTLFDKDRRRLAGAHVPLTNARMVHDFPATATKVIVPDLPLEFWPELAARGRFVFQFDPAKPARYGVLDRRCEGEVRWFDLPGHYVFHYVNAWDAATAAGQPAVRLYGCVARRVELALDREHPTLLEDGDAAAAPRLARIELNLADGSSSLEYLLPEDLPAEFPVIHQGYVGGETRYCYLAYYHDAKAEAEVAHRESCFFAGWLKYDLRAERLVGKVPFGPTHTSGEVFFAPRDGAAPAPGTGGGGGGGGGARWAAAARRQRRGRSFFGLLGLLKEEEAGRDGAAAAATAESRDGEDDGYVMGMVYDRAADASEFVVWDARTLKERCRLKLRQRVPHGFHSLFVPEAELAGTAGPREAAATAPPPPPLQEEGAEEKEWVEVARAPGP